MQGVQWEHTAAGEGAATNADTAERARPRLATLLIGLVLLPACGGLGGTILGPSYREWAQGPVRWLLLPEELRSFRRLRNDRDAALFIAEFWRRRDPAPEAPGNAFYDRFEERVTAADRLYGEDGRRGSLTERGRALVLLGPPPTLRVSQQAAPVWDPERPARNPRFNVRQLSIEAWEYGAEDLWPSLVDLLVAAGGTGSVSLTFVVETDRTRLSEGDRALELAALASVRSPG
jgi:GWxTD domain-containing protein